MIDLHFFVGFIIGALVALELGSRIVLRKLRQLDGSSPSTADDKEWELPI